MSLLALLKRNGPSGFGYGSTADDVARDLDLGGQTWVLTGCNSGIGFETLKTLAARGARVLAAARTVERASEACARVSGDTVPVACELSDPGSVRAAVSAIRAVAPAAGLTGLVLNAGIMALPERTLLHGVEAQFFTNHVGHFLLTTGLLDVLAANARVVIVSSDAHRAAPGAGVDFDNLDGAKGYGAWRFYGQSKLANLLFARSLGQRFAGTARRAFAVHPGVIQTNLGRHMPAIARGVMAVANPVFLKSPAQGAATQVWAAVHPDAAAVSSGSYLADSNVSRPTRHGQDDALAERLWSWTEGFVSRLP
jgi:NAD(P)-dependent dehydrogenase (short-subunit alcohol dehydrogenase family)